MGETPSLEELTLSPLPHAPIPSPSEAEEKQEEQEAPDGEKERSPAEASEEAAEDASRLGGESGGRPPKSSSGDEGVLPMSTVEGVLRRVGKRRRERDDRVAALRRQEEMLRAEGNKEALDVVQKQLQLAEDEARRRGDDEEAGREEVAVSAKDILRGIKVAIKAKLHQLPDIPDLAKEEEQEQEQEGAAEEAGSKDALDEIMAASPEAARDVLGVEPLSAAGGDDEIEGLDVAELVSDTDATDDLVGLAQKFRARNSRLLRSLRLGRRNG